MESRRHLGLLRRRGAGALARAGARSGSGEHPSRRLHRHSLLGLSDGGTGRRGAPEGAREVPRAPGRHTGRRWSRRRVSHDQLLRHRHGDRGLRRRASRRLGLLIALPPRGPRTGAVADCSATWIEKWIDGGAQPPSSINAVEPDSFAVAAGDEHRST